jgi:hypothetical protein
MHTFQHMTGKLATLRQSLHHLIDNRRLTLSVDAAQDIYTGRQFPNNVLLTAPQGVNLDPFDIVSVFLHNLLGFDAANIVLFFHKYKFP